MAVCVWISLTKKPKRQATRVQIVRRVVRVRPYSHQPTKAEMEADISIPNITPEELARVVLQPVTLKVDK